MYFTLKSDSTWYKNSIREQSCLNPYNPASDLLSFHNELPFFLKNFKKYRHLHPLSYNS